VQDIFFELSDGVLLCKLVEIAWDKKVGSPLPTKDRHQKLKNVEKVTSNAGKIMHRTTM